VKGILADVNIQGQVDFLVVLMQAEPWKLFWEHLRIPYLHFPDVTKTWRRKPKSLLLLQHPECRLARNWCDLAWEIAWCSV